MVTEGSLPSENKFQVLHKTRLANLLLPRCSPWSGSSLGTPPAVQRVVHVRTERCAESLQAEMPSWWNCLLLLVSSLLLFSVSIHSGGAETSLFFSFILLVFHTYKQLLWQDNVYQSLL